MMMERCGFLQNHHHINLKKSKQVKSFYCHSQRKQTKLFDDTRHCNFSKRKKQNEKVVEFYYENVVSACPR